MTSSLIKLLALLDRKVGTPETGYWGSVRIDDELTKLLGQAKPELQALLLFKERLEWLHCGSGVKDREGFEWGVARVRFDKYGQVESVRWTNSDHSDLDAEMQRSKEAQ